MTATEDFIQTLSELKIGDLGLLRIHAGQRLDETTEAFDLFSGVWWPIRSRTPRAPRREVAWLVTKLYASFSIPHVAGKRLPHQLSFCRAPKDPDRSRFNQKFDRMIILPLSGLEPHLRWALQTILRSTCEVDWVRLTDDLSFWDREEIRLSWTMEFLGIRGDRDAN